MLNAWTPQPVDAPGQPGRAPDAAARVQA